MMIHVQMSEAPADPRLKSLLTRAAKATLKHQGANAAYEMSIWLTDDEGLRQLNLKHLGQDKSTDVLSFPADLPNPESGHPYLGDVAVSLPRAELQANEAGHKLEAELQLLVVHAVLHLLGHDHAVSDEKARMWLAKKEILSSLNFHVNIESLE